MHYYYITREDAMKNMIENWFANAEKLRGLRGILFFEEATYIVDG